MITFYPYSLNYSTSCTCLWPEDVLNYLGQYHYLQINSYTYYWTEAPFQRSSLIGNEKFQ